MAMLDTGSTMTQVPCDYEPHFAGFVPERLFGHIVQPLRGCSPRPVWLSVAHTIQLGDYRIQSVPVRSYAHRRDDGNAYQRGPILGSDIFRDVSVTIDLGSGTILIANEASAEAPSHVGEWDKIMPFKTKLPTRGIGLIGLSGTIVNQPAVLVFDSGESSASLVVTEPLICKRLIADQRRQVQLNKKERKNLDIAQSVFPDCRHVIFNVSWRLGDLPFRNQFVVVDTSLSSPGFQGLIGSPVLTEFRVAIDYPSHEFYLHRFRNYEHLKGDLEWYRRTSFGAE